MKAKIVYWAIFVLSIMMVHFMGGCKKKDEPTIEPPSSTLVEVLIDDFPADTGGVNKCTFISLETGKEIDPLDSATSKWDIALRRTAIYINGGTSGPGKTSAITIDGIFDEITQAPESGYFVDVEGRNAINGWYNYTGGDVPAHAILMVPGKVPIIKTGKGHYVKMEILSYYKGNPDTSTEKFKNLDTRAPSRYYTFRYIIQKNGTRNF